MATALDRITRALRLIRVLEAGESPSTNDAADALVAFNAMLDEWENDKLMIYAMRDESITMVNGTGSYTVGPSGDLVSDRPVAIEYAYMTESGTDYDVDIISRNGWDDISDKTSTSNLVQVLQFEATMPDATIKVWPVPDTANVLHIRTRIPFSVAALTDTVSLPPGYVNAIDFNLAIALASEFGVQAPAEVVERARKSKGAVKRINSRPILAAQDLAAVFGGTGSRNIKTDNAN